MAEVVLENVTKRYGNVIGVDRASLRCADGEFLALLGPSGCGKSSTMRMIAGLEEISEGSILIDGERVNNKGPASRNVAMAFENFGLYPHRTVFGNIAYPLRVRGQREDETIARAVVEIASLLGIADLLDQYPGRLSVGAKQRVSLARALVRRPAVFLMDEPFSHVDAELRGHMRTELKRLHTVNGSTSIYVTHDQVEALSMADRIVVMNRGVIQQIGTPAEVYQHPANRFVAQFIGEPPMNFLRAAVLSEPGSGIYRFQVEDSVLGQIEAGRWPAKAGSSVDIGVRPDDFLLSDDRGLPGVVRVREVIGLQALLTIDTEQHRLRVRVDREIAPKEGSSLRLLPAENRLHFFDQATELAMSI